MSEAAKALHQEEVEQAVISSCLMVPNESMARIAGRLSEQAFFDRRHQAIYHVLLSLHEAGEVIDPFTVMKRLEADGTMELVKKDYIGWLLDANPTSDGIEAHAAIIEDAAKRRKVIEVARELIESAGKPSADIEASVQSVFSKLLPYAMNEGDTNYRRLDTATTIKNIELRGSSPESVLRFGFRCIDDVFHGFRPGELVIVGGSAKSGKTTFTINAARNVAECGHAVGFQSCEMSRDALQERLLAAVAQVHVSDLAAGRLSNEEWESMAKAGHYLNQLPFEIDDTAMPTIDEVAAKVMALKARVPRLRMVVVDFLQLVTADLRGRTEASTLAYISYRLKALAKTADIVLVAPVQLNHKQIDAEHREPELRDLQGSSGMAQAADAVLLCWRDQTIGFSGEYLKIKCAASRRTEQFKASLVWNGRFMAVDDPQKPKVDQSTGEVLE